jgi:hypothetical protein
MGQTDGKGWWGNPPALFYEGFSLCVTSGDDQT